MSHKSQRLTWRARCRRWQRYINALLAVAVALVLVAQPVQAQPVQAQTTVRCRWPWQPAKIRLVNGSWGWTCLYVWEGRGR